MKEDLEYNCKQEVVLLENPEQYRKSSSYREAVTEIETLAGKLKKNLLEELQSLDALPKFLIGDTDYGYSNNMVEGLLINYHKLANSFPGDLIFLVPNEGLVRVPWDIGDPYIAAAWDKGTEVSAQDYIKYSPTAFLEITRFRYEGKFERIEFVEINVAVNS